jgi:hypothetical protein
MTKHYFLKQKKNKKAKVNYNKLTLIDAYTRDYVLKEYFALCNLRFDVNFFETRT